VKKWGELTLETTDHVGVPRGPDHGTLSGKWDGPDEVHRYT